MSEVVVGVDGSACAAVALKWAARYAASRDLPLTVVMAWDYLSQPHTTDGEPFDPAYSEASAQEVLDGFVAATLGDSNTATRKPVLDRPGPAIVGASSSASLVVVGARGLGGFRGLLLGSVSRYVLHHATCPVAVIREAVEDGNGPVIVGVDGRESSIRAIQWAAEFASSQDREVLVAHVWQLPVTTMVGPLGLVDVRDQLEQAANEVTTRTIERAELAPDRTDVASTVIEGPPAAELLSLADRRRASMIVVGARHESRLGFRLGSVSDQIAQHAPCPVVVVP